MSIATIRPTASTVVSGTWTPSSGTLHGAAGDNNDVTYVTPFASGTGNGQELRFTLANFTVPTTAQIRSVRPKMLATTGSGEFYFWIRDSTTGAKGPTSRLVASSPFTTYLGVSMTTAPGNVAWTQSKLDDIEFVIFNQDGTGQAYLHEAYVEIEYNVPPVITGVSMPAQTVSAIASFQHTYSDADGDIQERARYYVYEAAQYSAGGFVAGTTTPFYDSGILYTSSNTWTCPVELYNGTWRAYIQVSDLGSGGRWTDVTATYSSVLISVVPPATPTILSATADPANSKISVALRDFQNQLGENTSSFEASIGSWSTLANSTITRVASPGGTPSPDGAFVGSLTSVASGTYSMQTPTGLGGFACKASTVHSVMAYVRGAVFSRTVTLQVQWYKSDGTASTVTPGVVTVTSASSSLTGFVQITGTVTSPSDAAYVRMIVSVAGAGAGSEVQYIDKLGVFPATTTTWSRGGIVGGGHIELEYSLDNATWTQVPRLYTPAIGVNSWTSVASSPHTQEITTEWYEAPIGQLVYLRARTKFSAGSASVVSNYSSSTSLTLNMPANHYKWRFKSLYDPPQNYLFEMKGPDFTRRSLEQAAFFNPVSRIRSVKVTDTIQGDVFGLTVMCLSAADASAVLYFRHLQSTILIEAPDGRTWYVAFNNEFLSADYFTADSFYREYTASFEEQDAPPLV